MGVQQWCRLTQNAKCLFIISSAQCTAAVHYELKASNWCLVEIQLTFSGVAFSFFFFFFYPGYHTQQDRRWKYQTWWNIFQIRWRTCGQEEKCPCTSTSEATNEVKSTFKTCQMHWKPAQKKLLHNKPGMVCEWLWAERLWLKMPEWHLQIETST